MSDHPPVTSQMPWTGVPHPQDLEWSDLLDGRPARPPHEIADGVYAGLGTGHGRPRPPRDPATGWLREQMGI